MSTYKQKNDLPSERHSLHGSSCMVSVGCVWSLGHFRVYSCLHIFNFVLSLLFFFVSLFSLYFVCLFDRCIPKIMVVCVCVCVYMCMCMCACMCVFVKEESEREK